MKLTIEMKKVKALSKKELDFMNKQRIREYGKESIVDFKKRDKNAVFFLVRDNNKIMAFGMLKPVTIEYQNRKYHILGMGRGMAVKKGKEHGRILNAARIYYAKKRGKTVLAFTSRKNMGFFEKAGFKIAKDLAIRFRYKYATPEEEKRELEEGGDGVYYEGKDKLISKMLKTKSLAYTNVPFW